MQPRALGHGPGPSAGFGLSAAPPPYSASEGPLLTGLGAGLKSHPQRFASWVKVEGSRCPGKQGTSPWPMAAQPLGRGASSKTGTAGGRPGVGTGDPGDSLRLLQD